MQTDEFCKTLKRALKPLLPAERERYLANYRELIADKCEGGMNEAEAVASLGSAEEVAAPILADAKEQGLLKPKRSPLTIGLLALGSPVWASLGVVAAAVVLALYVVFWALIVCVCAAALSFAIVVPASLIFFAANLGQNAAFAFFVLGLGIVCAGLTLWLYKPVLELIRSTVARTAQSLRKLRDTVKQKGSALL